MNMQHATIAIHTLRPVSPAYTERITGMKSISRRDIAIIEPVNPFNKDGENM